MTNSISVIVTHHNRPGVVREALESVRGQTLKPVEIIVVDDASRPGNRKKLDQFANFARVIVTPGNLGLAGARNFGAAAARGEWLCFLDDDDLYLPDKLERQVRYLDAHPAAEALGGALTMTTPDGRREHWGGKYTRRIAIAEALQFTASMAQALMIRRKLFYELGGFNPALRYLEDYEFGIRLVASNHEVHFLGEPLFLYRCGGKDQLSRRWSKMFAAEVRVLRMHRGLVRREFGPLGPIRMYARCFKKCGLRKGRLIGRSSWVLGCFLEGVFGRQLGQYDS